MFDLTRWPVILVCVLAGCAAICFAFVTVNLFAEAMASIDFLAMFRGEAVRHGALWQIVELLAWGALALMCWTLFKICEHELTDRYFRWARRNRDKTSSST